MIDDASPPAEVELASDVSFRRATSRDRDVLLALCAAYRRADSLAEAPAEISAAVDAALAMDPLIHLFLIELPTPASSDTGSGPSAERQVIGYLAVTLGFSIEVGGRDAFLDELYLAPEVRGRGIGARAVRFAEQLCSALDVRRICLEVVHANTAAHRLYERLGYQVHARSLMSKRISCGD